MYEYSVRSSDNNGWGIDGKIENAGEQTVLRVEIGEKTDIRTGKTTPLYEMVYQHIADAKTLFNIETNNEEFPLVRIKSGDRYVPHNPEFTVLCDKIAKAAENVPDSIRRTGMRDLKNMVKNGIQITNSKEFIKANIFKYEIQDALKSDKPYSFDFLADVLILRKEEQLKTMLQEPDNAEAALFVQNYYDEMCSLILQLDKHLINQEEMKKKASEILDVTPDKINPQLIRTECVREGWKRNC